MLVALLLVGQAIRLPACAMSEYRRKLPHFHPDQSYLFLTFRLWGSRPRTINATAYPTRGHAFAAEDRALARCDGPTWLRDPRIGELVANTILFGDCQKRFYELYAWVVMPNHVHLLILPLVAVPNLMRWLKGSTARGANQMLNRTGQAFWQAESYDHYLRNASQIGKTVAYIEENPRAAGLVQSPEDWRWSSAGWGRRIACPTGASSLGV